MEPAWAPSNTLRRLSAALRVDVEPDGVPAADPPTTRRAAPHRHADCPEPATRSRRPEVPGRSPDARGSPATAVRIKLARSPRRSHSVPGEIGDRGTSSSAQSGEWALARKALQPQRGPHRAHRRCGETGAARGARPRWPARRSRKPYDTLPTEAPRVRHDLDLHELGLDKSVRGIRLAALPATPLGSRQFPDLGTHLKRRTWRPPRTRTARLLTPPARRGGPRQPLDCDHRNGAGRRSNASPSTRAAAAPTPRSDAPADRSPAAPPRPAARPHSPRAAPPARDAVRHSPGATTRSSTAAAATALFEKPTQTRRLATAARLLRLPAQLANLGPAASSSALF